MRATFACSLLAAGGCALEMPGEPVGPDDPGARGCAAEMHSSPLVDLGCHASTTLLGWILPIVPPPPFGPYVLGSVGICYRLDATDNRVAAQFVAGTSPKPGDRSGFVLRLRSGGAVVAEGEDVHEGDQTHARLSFVVPRGEVRDVVLTVEASGGACRTDVGYGFSEAAP
jgi:hypothetical protein